MRTTKQKLDKTNEQYEDMLFVKYAKWCESVSGNDKQFQMVLANAAISKWFMTEFAKCEAEFHKLTNPYEGSNTVSTKDLQKCFDQCAYKMFNIRPMPLLEEIKKRQAFGFMRIQGVRIEALTFNQN